MEKLDMFNKTTSNKKEYISNAAEYLYATTETKQVLEVKMTGDKWKDKTLYLIEHNGMYHHSNGRFGKGDPNITFVVLAQTDLGQLIKGLTCLIGSDTEDYKLRLKSLIMYYEAVADSTCNFLNELNVSVDISYLKSIVSIFSDYRLYYASELDARKTIIMLRNTMWLYKYAVDFIDSHILVRNIAPDILTPYKELIDNLGTSSLEGNEYKLSDDYSKNDALNALVKVNIFTGEVSYKDTIFTGKYFVTIGKLVLLDALKLCMYGESAPDSLKEFVINTVDGEWEH